MNIEKIKTNYGTISKTNDKLVIHHNDGNVEGFIKSNTIEEGIRQIIESIILIGLGVTYFNTDVTIVSGRSMSPTYHNLQIIVKSKLAASVNKLMLNRGTIIKFKDPSNVTSIKRIVGIPGDIVEFEFRTVKINGEVIDINNSEPPPPGSYVNTLYTKAGTPYSRKGKSATLTLKDGEFFVMGDNKDNSTDSRNYGPITNTAIISIIEK